MEKFEKFVPRAEPQEIPYEVLMNSIPNDGKWEWSHGHLFFSDEELKKVTLMLIGHIGLRKMVEYLPNESVNELERVLLLRPESKG
ncbi:MULTISPECIES: hypothetical protein [Brevibacillus]|uniref:hypothetical protein n=1 Tax=Brevibacillus TaxID=55080 RepID=UPI00175C82CC|nr:MULTISPECIES: hypothetical protein [Brevibacillus]MDR9507578.1 hypothetical protein [Brevibacillus agri]WNF05532.1 hypothetical protein RFB14_24920 [Brevibacillus borstelensis]HAJ4019656.1 hypothetical protein [Escherichia coli]